MSILESTHMKIIFRTDASATIGHGHVMRCLTLASALRQRGAEVSFISREHIGHLCDLIEERGFAVSRLPPANGKHPIDETPVHAAWLGTPWQEDAAQTRDIIKALGDPPDWLIVDHYALDQRWENGVREPGGRIMVIDDLADRPHSCDLLLDQNLVASLHTRYNNKVPESCGRLLGPEYALLQPIYADLHPRMAPREGPVLSVLIAFGGADAANITGLALAAFLSLDRPDVMVDVVFSAASPHADSLREQAEGRPNVSLHHDLPTLAYLMVKADLAVGAAGATSWERLCLGLPALVISLAENQRPIARELDQRSLVRWLGHKGEVDESALSRPLARFLEKGHQNEQQSLKCFATVDGRGAEKVCAALTMTKTTALTARHAKLADETALLEWSGIPAGRKNALSEQRDFPATFRVWFRATLRDTTSQHLYILETEEQLPLAQVRFVRVKQKWSTEFNLAPHADEQVLARRLLQAAILQLRKDEDGALRLEQAIEAKQALGDLLRTQKDNVAEEKQDPWIISVCSDQDSWINAMIPDLLLRWLSLGHQVNWAHDAALLPTGDICFYLGYGRIVGPELLARHRNSLVVHESDLPRGRGWSPMSWQILGGKSKIPVTLFEAALAVDSGPIYKQVEIAFSGTELIEDLRAALAQATLQLCRDFVKEYPEVAGTGIPQAGEATVYPRRKPEHSELDVDRSIRKQFNLLRIVDYERYPAWFWYEDVKFKLKIEKVDSR